MNNFDTTTHNSDVLYRAGKRLEVDTVINEYEYSAKDWGVICDLIGLDPENTTDIHLNGSVVYVGDTRGDNYVTKMSIDTFIDTFGLEIYQKVEELYEINDYADKKPAIIFKNLDKIMDMANLIRKMGVNDGSISELVSHDCIIKNIIKVIYE